MNEFAGYPVVPCPECGASDSVEIVRPLNPGHAFGPGEWALYRCSFCDTGWKAIVPEPPDVSVGIGGIP